MIVVILLVSHVLIVWIVCITIGEVLVVLEVLLGIEVVVIAFVVSRVCGAIVVFVGVVTITTTVTVIVVSSAAIHAFAVGS